MWPLYSVQQEELCIRLECVLKDIVFHSGNGAHLRKARKTRRWPTDTSRYFLAIAQRAARNCPTRRTLHPPGHATAAPAWILHSRNLIRRKTRPPPLDHIERRTVAADTRRVLQRCCVVRQYRHAIWAARGSCHQAAQLVGGGVDRKRAVYYTPRARGNHGLACKLGLDGEHEPVTPTRFFAPKEASLLYRVSSSGIDATLTGARNG